MLYLYCGTDEHKTRARLQTTLAVLLEKAPHAHVERVTDEVGASFSFEDLLAIQGLFYAKRIIIFDHVFTDTHIQKEILGQLSELARSEHIFFIHERSLTKPQEEKIKKHAQKIEHHEAKNQKKPEKKDHFALARAFGAKRRKDAWVEYHRQLFQNGVPEAIHGMLFWKVKDSLLKGFTSERSRKELERMASLLAALPHETRRRGVEIEYALEKFILEHV